MKKLLSVLLVLAMAVSCIAVVQMTTLAASKETVIVDENFESFDAGSNPGLYQNQWGETVSVESDDAAHGKVLKFSSNGGWKAPSWKIGEKAAEIYANKAASDFVTLRISFDIKAAKAGSTFQATMRQDNTSNVSSMSSSETVGTEWKSFSYFYEYTPDKSKFNIFTVDNLNNSAEGYFIDNLKIVAGIGPRETVNGNAENGTKGWDTFREIPGSTIEQVEGGANGTAHAIKFSVGNGNKWASIAFNMGPSIIKDEVNGYCGGGADTYKLTFWAKAAQGKGGKFSVFLNSQFHKHNKDAVKNSLTDEQYKEIEDIASATYITCSAITMTDEWQKFEVEIPVSENYLKLMSKLYSFGKKDAYELILRLDGTLDGGAFTNSTFDYYVDEVTIVSASAATPTPGEEATPTPTPQAATGFTAELVNDVTEGGQGQWFKTNTGVFSAADVANNKLTVKFPVKNTGNQDIKVRLELQTIHKKGDGNPVWAGPSEGAYVDIPAGETVDLEYSADVKNGKISVTAYDNTVEYDVSEFFARIDIKNADGGDTFDKGMAFTAFTGKKLADAFFEMKDENRKGEFYKVELTYANPAESGDLLPVAFIAVAVVATAALVVVSRKRKFNA